MIISSTCPALFPPTTAHFLSHSPHPDIHDFKKGFISELRFTSTMKNFYKKIVGAFANSTNSGRGRCSKRREVEKTVSQMIIAQSSSFIYTHFLHLTLFGFLKRHEPHHHHHRHLNLHHHRISILYSLPLFSAELNSFQSQVDGERDYLLEILHRR